MPPLTPPIAAANWLSSLGAVSSGATDLRHYHEQRTYISFEPQSLAPKYPGSNKDLDGLRFGQVGRMRHTCKTAILSGHGPSTHTKR
jgi:hypothetical protein